MLLDNIAVLLGKNIACQRRRLGMTQKELAEKLNITENSITRMEKGIIAPKIARLEDLATHLECSVAYLFDDKTKYSKIRVNVLQNYIEKVSPKEQEDFFTIFTAIQKLQKCKFSFSDELVVQLIMTILNIIKVK